MLEQIGLLEPRYLPQGPQTLKSLRFPTHTPQPEKQQKSKSNEARGKIAAEIQKLKSRDGARAGTTPPSDPNAA